MRRMLLALGVLATCTAACTGAGTGPGSAVPMAARLSADRLTVTLSDAATCRAAWTAAPQGGFADCPGLGYRVAVVENPNLLRQLLDGVTAALGGEGVLAPMAEVTVTDGTRDWRFVSPPPPEE